MPKLFVAASLAGCLALGTIAVTVRAQVAARTGVSATGALAAAQHFLTLLNEEQKSVASFAFDAAIKSQWHNLPPQMNKRAGVRFSALTPEQKEAGTAVVKAVLSNYGYQKVQDILAADKYLGEEMGVGFPTGPDAYMLAIFGTPSPTAPWSVQFNGHHLGVNVTIVGSQNVLAPTLTAPPRTRRSRFRRSSTSRSLRTVTVETPNCAESSFTAT